MVLTFDLVMDFDGRLTNQKQASRNHHEILPGDLMAEQRADRMSQLHDPADGEQQHDPRHNRQQQPQLSCPVTLSGWEISRLDRDENDVVDPEHDLQRGQRQECDQAVDRQVFIDLRHLCSYL